MGEQRMVPEAEAWMWVAVALLLGLSLGWMGGAWSTGAQFATAAPCAGATTEPAAALGVEV